MVDKVQEKKIVSICYTPSSKPYSVEYALHSYCTHCNLLYFKKIVSLCYTPSSKPYSVEYALHSYCTHCNLLYFNSNLLKH